MNPKRARFVAEYLVDLNATQAAIRAGYSEKTAASQGVRLLRDAKVAALVAEGKSSQLSDAGLSAARVLEELRRLAMSDVRGLFDAAGNLKPLHELTDEQAACVAGVEVVKKNIAAGDGHVDILHKVKVWDKPKALDLLAKHFGLLEERVRHEGEIRIQWQS